MNFLLFYLRLVTDVDSLGHILLRLRASGETTSRCITSAQEEESRPAAYPSVILA